MLIIYMQFHISSSVVMTRYAMIQVNNYGLWQYLGSKSNLTILYSMTTPLYITTPNVMYIVYLFTTGSCMDRDTNLHVTCVT